MLWSSLFFVSVVLSTVYSPALAYSCSQGCGPQPFESCDCQYCDSNYTSCCADVCKYCFDAEGCDTSHLYNCKDDECGGRCGTYCPDGSVCEYSPAHNTEWCVCQPDCGGKECGDDSCGGSCGTCDDDMGCINGKCCAVPCGNVCCEDEGFDAGLVVCGSDGYCCLPDCAGKECGVDGCGGTCGECSLNESCDLEFKCVCVPRCLGLACGNDGCGGFCGYCSDGQECVNGSCEEQEIENVNDGEGSQGCSASPSSASPSDTCLPMMLLLHVLLALIVLRFLSRKSQGI